MEKQKREIIIGKMIARDKTLYQDIQSGIKEAKRKLFLTNDIEDLNIVSIKNDAVFIVGKYLQNTIFPPFEFKIKNEYNIFLQLQELEIYYAELRTRIYTQIILSYPKKVNILFKFLTLLIYNNG